MNPIIPLGAVALALAGFMFWKKDNYTDYQYPPATPVVPPDFAPPAILPAPLAPYVPPAFAGQPPIDYGDEGGDWFTDNYVAPMVQPNFRGTGASEQAFWEGRPDG